MDAFDAFWWGSIFGAVVFALVFVRRYRCLNQHCGFRYMETTPDVAPRAEQALRQGLHLALTDLRDIPCETFTALHPLGKHLKRVT